MNIYSPTHENDLLLAQLWANIAHAGDLERTFSGSCHALSGFMRLFQAPNALLFEADDEGIWFALWFEPILSGAFAGLWISPRKRRARQSVASLREGLAMGLKYWPVILGVTKQEKLLAPHRKLGYDILCQIPFIFDGEGAWLVALTREGFENGGRRQAARSGSARQQRA